MRAFTAALKGWPLAGTTRAPGSPEDVAAWLASPPALARSVALPDNTPQVAAIVRKESGAVTLRGTAGSLVRPVPEGSVGRGGFDLSFSPAAALAVTKGQVGRFADTDLGDTLLAQMKTLPKGAPLDLDPQQRRDLAMPGIVWWAQVHRMEHGGSERAFCRRLEGMFARSAVEPLDDWGDDDHELRRKVRLLVEVRDAFAKVYGGLGKRDQKVILLASQLWLERLVGEGILEMNEGGTFALAMQEFNEAILGAVSRSKFDVVLRPAQTIADETLAAFRDLGYFLPLA